MKKILTFISLCVFMCVFALNCTSPVVNKAGGGKSGVDTDPKPDADEAESYEEETIKVTLKSGGDTKSVSVKRGVVIIGANGVSGANESTVWIEDPGPNTPQFPDDINLIPMNASQTFIPWTSENYVGYDEIKLIKSKLDFQTIPASSGSSKIIYVLTSDFEVNSWDKAIGSKPDSFNDWFTGGGHYIKNVQLASSNEAALFGLLNGARIDNLRVILTASKEISQAGEVTVVSPVAGQITGTSTTVIKRVAVSMDKDAASVIKIGAHPGGESNKIYFGGIVASIDTQGEARIEECAVFVTVTADTGANKSHSLDERISVGGIVGDISNTGKVIIANCYSLGSAKIIGTQPPNSNNDAYNYPKFAGGIVGYIGSGPTSPTTPTAIYNNYSQFDITITGGIAFDPAAGGLFTAANGIIGARSQVTSAYMAVYGNYVMAKSLSCNSGNVRGVLFVKNPPVLYSSCSNTAIGGGGTYANFIWREAADAAKPEEPPKGTQLLDNREDPPKAQTVPNGETTQPGYAAEIFCGNVLTGEVILNKAQYEISGWDMSNIWKMGSDNSLNFNMANLVKSMQTAAGKNFGSYPYPVLKWLGNVLPAPQNFQPVAWPALDPDGYDADGYNKQGYYKDEPYLNRAGYDKYGIYGGYANAETYYITEEVKDQGTYCTMQAPGFSWDNPDYYKPNTTYNMVMGDWSQKSDFADIPVPIDHGQVDDGRSAAAGGIPCPWVDLVPADGFHDALLFDKNGFKQGSDGTNIYGYKRNGTHTDGYANAGTINGNGYTAGFDIFGFPCPWIDLDNDGYNDVTGLDENWTPK